MSARLLPDSQVADVAEGDCSEFGTTTTKTRKYSWPLGKTTYGDQPEYGFEYQFLIEIFTNDQLQVEVLSRLGIDTYAVT